MKMYVKRFMQRMMKMADKNNRQEMGTNVPVIRNLDRQRNEPILPQNYYTDLDMTQRMVRNLTMGPVPDFLYTMGTRHGLPMYVTPPGMTAEMINKLVELGYDLHKDMVRARLENPNLYKIDPTGLGPNWQNRSLYNRELLRLMSEK